MQVYIHMDVGTDKPLAEARRQIRHHCIDLVCPDQDFNAALYREAAAGAIQSISRSREKIFVVGGTGLYIRALIHGLFNSVQIPWEIREGLRREAEEQGGAVLHQELTRVDPHAAMQIHPNDTFRVVRALEVCRATGVPISLLQQRHGFSDDPYRVLKLAIDQDRGALYRGIDARVDRMMEHGLVEEVQRLLKLGYGRDLKSMQGLGYRQIGAYLDGEFSLKRAVELLKRDSRRYAKRQWTWFKKDREIHWLTGNFYGEALEEVKKFLKV
jgi:tRNA dimethylallyltransferase